MTVVSNILRDRWFSRRHVGGARPVCRAFIRKGHFTRGFAPWAVDGRSLFDCYILGHRGNPWSATWIQTTPYVELPNVLSWEADQGFDNNGVQSGTLVLENVVMEAVGGMAGIFHKIRRGLMSPFRGFNPLGRPPLRDSFHGDILAPNSWFNLLNTNAQVTIWGGYGDDEEGLQPIFTGLIDVSTLTSKPDRIEVTIRDFGQALSDQKIFGWVKDRRLKDPIVFADRKKSDDVLKVGHTAKASSSSPGHLPRFVLDSKDKTGDRTYWASAPRAGPNDTEWVEIQLPQGTYEEFLIYPYYAGMEMYVSFYAHALKPSRHNSDLRPFVNGVRRPAGWVDLGKGTVPDEDGGKPYVLKVNSLSARSRTYGLGCKVFTGDGAKLRIHFRKLRQSDINKVRGHRAGVRRLSGLRRRQSQTSKKEQWIRVNDLADVVKCCLRWGGFKEWEIEQAGHSLSDPLVVNRQNTLMDVIAKMGELTGYVFAMQPIDDFAMSNMNAHRTIGVPIWRRSAVYDPESREIEMVRDTDLLTGIKVQLTDEPKSHVIVTRGKTATKKQGGTFGGGGGHGGTMDRRLQARYYPPWGGVFGQGVGGQVDFGSDALAGLAKPTVHIDPQLRTQFECKIACLLIAVQEALASCTGVIELPFYPGFELDDMVGVSDTGTAINSRLWIAQKHVSYNTGKFVMTLQGSLIDNPDMYGVVFDYLATIVQQQAELEKTNSSSKAQADDPVLPTRDIR